jgi:hypothetical protein
MGRYRCSVIQGGTGLETRHSGNGIICASLAWRNVRRVADRIACSRADPVPRPRKLREFRECYDQWSSQVFTFCRLLCGERERAELCTEQVFMLFFQSADCIVLDSYSEIPVALLRFAFEITEIHCQEPMRAEAQSRAQALLALPFRDRAVFILISVMGLRRSAAAVALGMGKEQLRRRWLDAALHLRRFWLQSAH